MARFLRRALLGPFDFVSIVEAPDNETVARVSAELALRGSVRIQTLPAMPVESIIQKMQSRRRPRGRHRCELREGRAMIREAGPEDALALAELERLCPEVGRATVRIDPLASHLELASRYPGSRGYVALGEDNAAVIGTIFSSVAPTQLNGGVLPAAYLFSLRVHPGYRRRSVASSLIAHACERALAEEGAGTVWAAVVEGNDASLMTFQRAGFVRLRDLRAKIVLGGLARPRRLPRLATRSASSADLPAIAEAANRYHARHNFWRPKTWRQLQAELEALHHSLWDTEIALAQDGTPLAAASALELPRLARLRLLSLRALPAALDRLIQPLYGLLPLDTLLIHHYFSPADEPAVAAALLRALHRRYLPRSWAAIVVADPLDQLISGLDLLVGTAGRVHLVAKSDEIVDQSRPSWLP